MANWRTKINLAQFLEDETETPEAVLKAAENIKSEIDKNPYARRAMTNLPHLLVEKTKKAVEAGFGYDVCCDVFNGALSKIYDRADAELVWTNG